MEIRAVISEPASITPLLSRLLGTLLAIHSPRMTKDIQANRESEIDMGRAASNNGGQESAVGLFDNQENNLRAEKPLTLNGLCEFLGCKKSTLNQYNREGMPRFFVGKQCRYLISKVIDWLERRALPRITPTEETFDPRKELQNASKRLY